MCCNIVESSEAAPKAAEKRRITAQKHYRLKIADGIIPFCNLIPYTFMCKITDNTCSAQTLFSSMLLLFLLLFNMQEPLGGAHADPKWTSQQIKLAITQAMEELSIMDKEELLQHRMLKFRHIGGFQEGMPVEPEMKRNMKPSEVNNTKTADIELELENLRKKILESKRPSEPISNEAIEKLKQDVGHEITNALISMGLPEKFEAVKLELSKSPNHSPNQPLNGNLKEKADKIMEEVKHNLSRPGAYLRLKQKLEQLNLVHRLIEFKDRSEKLKSEINQKVPDDVKAKMELLANAERKLLRGDPLDKNLVEEAERAKKELMKILISSDLEIVGIAKTNVATPPPALREKIERINKEIREEIERVINAGGLSGKVMDLKSEATKGSSSGTVEKMESEIKERILSALDVNTLKEKFENLRLEVASGSKTTEDETGAENGGL